MLSPEYILVVKQYMLVCILLALSHRMRKSLPLTFPVSVVAPFAISNMISVCVPIIPCRSTSLLSFSVFYGYSQWTLGQPYLHFQSLLSHLQKPYFQIRLYSERWTLFKSLCKQTLIKRSPGTEKLDFRAKNISSDIISC